MPAARRSRPGLAAALRLACRRMVTRTPHICDSAGCHGLRGYDRERAAARGIVRGRLAPPSSYTSYINISTYLLTADQRGDGMSPPTATHSGARIAQFCARAVSTQRITALIGRQERCAPLTRVLPRGMSALASGSASRSVKGASVLRPKALPIGLGIQAGTAYERKNG